MLVEVGPNHWVETSMIEAVDPYGAATYGLRIQFTSGTVRNLTFSSREDLEDFLSALGIA